MYKRQVQLPEALRARGALVQPVVEAQDPKVSIGSGVAQSSRLLLTVPAPPVGATGALATLLAEVGAVGAILDLSTAQPTLEQVFLSLTTEAKPQGARATS